MLCFGFCLFFQWRTCDGKNDAPLPFNPWRRASDSNAKSLAFLKGQDECFIFMDTACRVCIKSSSGLKLNAENCSL